MKVIRKDKVRMMRVGFGLNSKNRATSKRIIKDEKNHIEVKKTLLGNEERQKGMRTFQIIACPAEHRHH